MGNESSRQTWIDGLRLLAAVAVVVLHLAGPLLRQASLNRPDVVNAAAFSMSLVAWCVPVFIMISGALNLGGQMAPREFYRKRWIWVPRTCFWSVFYIGLRLTQVPGTTLAVIAHDTLKGVPYFHLWFLFTLLGLYAVTPLLGKLTRNPSPTIRITLPCLILAASAWITAALPNGMDILQNNIVTLFIPFIGYYWLGYALAQRSTQPRWLALVLTLVPMLALIVAPHIHPPRLARILMPPAPFFAFSYPVIIMSIGIFMLAQSCASSKASAAWLPAVGRLTFGIYVIHPIFLRLLALGVGSTTSGLSPLASIWLFAILVFIAALIATWALSRLPYVRRLVL